MAKASTSKGHLAWIPDTCSSYWEYFAVGEHVYRAWMGAPVMPDGRRSGRWYCPLWQWKRDKS